MDQPIPLVERLRAAASLWVAADEGNRTLARLGRNVINDGGFFTRIASPPATVTTLTLERFARFLGESANWPDCIVPGEVLSFVHVVGINALQSDPSPDNGASAIGQARSNCGACARTVPDEVENCRLVGCAHRATANAIAA